MPATAEKQFSLELFIKTAPTTFDQYCISSGNREFRKDVKHQLLDNYLVVSSHGRTGVESKIFRFDEEFEEVVLIHEIAGTRAAMKYIEELKKNGN